MENYKKNHFGGTGEEEEIRINKYLSDAGVCSRREADELVAGGKVLIDGQTAVMGSKVRPGQKVSLDGKELKQEERLVLIAFNKPEGIVCTTDQREPDNIIDFINYGSRIFPIGRLDKGSEGLILLTNDGEIVNKILRAGNGHEKEYIVEVNKPLTPEFLKGMAGGVPILDTVTKPCLVEQLDGQTFRIVLTQGLNRQIRRMCEYFDYRVRALKRIRIMNINLGRLKTGTWRNLTDWEKEELNDLLLGSSNGPAGEGEGVPERKMPPEGIVLLKPAAAWPARAPKKPADGNRKTAADRSKKPGEETRKTLGNKFKKPADGTGKTAADRFKKPVDRTGKTAADRFKKPVDGTGKISEDRFKKPAERIKKTVGQEPKKPQHTQNIQGKTKTKTAGKTVVKGMGWTTKKENSQGTARRIAKAKNRKSPTKK